MSPFGTGPNPHQLREYTVRFGFAIVDLFESLVSTARGVPLPSALPPALETFQLMEDEPGELSFGNLKDAFNYLRKGKYLVIPHTWRPFIPKEL